MKHAITQIRHELRRRTLTVRKAEHITPHMLRLTLGGEQLAGFTSLSPDDHIKIFVPGEQGEAERRDYTPRRYDAAANELNRRRYDLWRPVDGVLRVRISESAK